MKSGLHNRGIQEWSRAPLGLTGWLHSLVTWVVSASGLSTLLRVVLGQRSVHSQVQEARRESGTFSLCDERLVSLAGEGGRGRGRKRVALDK